MNYFKLKLPRKENFYYSGYLTGKYDMWYRFNLTGIFPGNTEQRYTQDPFLFAGLLGFFKGLLP